MASDDIGKAIKDARIAALFAFGCVVLVGLLLLIDGQRNKVMLEHVQQARRILEEFRVGVSEAVRDASDGEAGAATAGVGGTASGGSDDGSQPRADLESAPAAGTGQPEDGGAAAVPVNGARSRRAGMAGGPRGDG